MCDGGAPLGMHAADCAADVAINGGCCCISKPMVCVDDGICVDICIPLLPIVVGVNGRMVLAPTSGDSRFVRESMVRGDADGDGTAGGRYGL